MKMNARQIKLDTQNAMTDADRQEMSAELVRKNMMMQNLPLATGGK